MRNVTITPAVQAQLVAATDAVLAAEEAVTAATDLTVVEETIAAWRVAYCAQSELNTVNGLPPWTRHFASA